MFFVILHVQIDESNYRLLITLKEGRYMNVGKLCSKRKYCGLPWLDISPKKYHCDQTKSVEENVEHPDIVQLVLNPNLFSEKFYLHAHRRHKIRNRSLP